MSTNEPDGPPTDGGWQPPPPPPPPPPSPPTYGGGYQPPGPPASGPPTYGPPPAYGAPGGHQAPYGYQPYPAPQQTEGTAVGALIASILSFVVCPVVPAVVALALIPGSRRKIADSQGRLTGDSLLTAAKWISLVHLGLVALGVLAVIAVLVLGAASTSDTNTDFSLGWAVARSAVGR